MDPQEPRPRKNLGKWVSKLLPKLILIILVFAFGIWIGQNVALPFGENKAPAFGILNKNTPKEIQVDFAPFWDVWGKITTEYLEKNKLDPQQLVYGAISGLVDAVGDPYTVFLNPEQNSEFNLSLSGTYEGVGIELDVRNDQLIVVSPIEGTPAQKAGVQAGDKILEIDGISTSVLSIQEAVQKIRGQANTAVVITLKRDKKTFDLKLTRAKITLKSVEFEDLGKDIARIKIFRFGDNTLSEWRKATSKLVSGGFKKLILDLRNNPGGRLDHSISIAGDFVSKGTTVVLEEDASGKQLPFKSEAGPVLTGIRVVVLINKGSASASEIVAGALRDILGIKLVGETSFGKGTIQKVDDLPKGAGLHITFAKWLTPKGTWVNKKGLKPDVEIKLSEEDIKAKRDPQLDRALKLLE
ncbi:S41 family peptidase [Patescibacteria group bacterium]|nr:S41 family peptidase [Patescibacteria group bacterium]